MGNDNLIEIKVDKAKLRNIERMLAGVPKAMPRVISRGINRTISPAKTQISRGIRQEINIKSGDLNKKIKVDKATFAKWEGRIILSTKRIPLEDFGAKQTAKGVSYKIKKSGGRQVIESGFIATMTNVSGEKISTHRGVFTTKAFTHRVKKKNKTGTGYYTSELPIQEKFGPSIGVAFERAGWLVKKVQDDATKNLEKNIDSQVRFLLSRRKAG